MPEVYFGLNHFIVCQIKPFDSQFRNRKFEHKVTGVLLV